MSNQVKFICCTNTWHQHRTLEICKWPLDSSAVFLLSFKHLKNNLFRFYHRFHLFNSESAEIKSRRRTMHTAAVHQYKKMCCFDWSLSSLFSECICWISQYWGVSGDKYLRRAAVTAYFSSEQLLPLSLWGCVRGVYVRGGLRRWDQSHLWSPWQISHLLHTYTAFFSMLHTWKREDVHNLSSCFIQFYSNIGNFFWIIRHP